MEGIYLSVTLRDIPIPPPKIGPRKAKIVFSADATLVLADLQEDASPDGLTLLLDGFGVKTSAASDLKPCFDLDEMRRRNSTLK